MNLRLTGISECFSLKIVLESVSAEFKEGAIHALVGENGAGKSTLAAIISGSRQPTSGTILLDGKPVVLKTPREAAELGIIQIHQRPLLAEGITVKENILIGTEYQPEPAQREKISRRVTLARLSVYKKQWAPDLDLNSRVRNIGGDERFLTALLGALCRSPSILILDEPSALLNWEQRRILYANLRTLAQGGMNILIITHSMEEASLYTDTVTVLAEGRILATYARSSDFLQGCPGYIDFKKPDLSGSVNQTDEIIQPVFPRGFISFNSITVRPVNRPAIFGISFSFHCSELTLIRGLQESGLGTLENVITAMESSHCTGSFLMSYTEDPINDEEIYRRNLAVRPLTPAILRKKMHVKTAIIPSDRTFRGSNPNLTVGQMLTAYYTGKNHEQYAMRLITKAGISITTGEPVSDLSGGMLQRLILERELDMDPVFIILCEPLQGLDSRSSAALCRRLYNLSKTGNAVLVLSAADFPESFCTSIYTLKDGKLIHDGRRKTQ